MNLRIWIDRVRGRATCLQSPSTRLFPSARILNSSGDSSRIVIGENTAVRGELFIFGHGGRIQIGDWCFIGENSKLWSGASIRVGDRVMIAHDVNVFDNQTHPIDHVQRHEHFRSILTKGHPRNIDLGDRPVIIDDDAWLGAGSSILRGVTVGKRAIVASRAVVTHDVPDDCIVAGNPARIVRGESEKAREPRDSSRLMS